MAAPPAVPPGPAPAAPTPVRPVPAGRTTSQPNWIWWLMGGLALFLVLLMFFAGRATNGGFPTTPAKPPPAPAVAELERATAIVKAADEYRKVLGCDDCSTKVEAAVREAELRNLRKQVEELAATKPPMSPPTGKLDITVRQAPLPPLPPPARHPCEPVDPCYRRQPH